jgi:hypothetical protein
MAAATPTPRNRRLSSARLSIAPAGPGGDSRMNPAMIAQMYSKILKMSTENVRAPVTVSEQGWGTCSNAGDVGVLGRSPERTATRSRARIRLPRCRTVHFAAYMDGVACGVETGRGPALRVWSLAATLESATTPQQLRLPSLALLLATVQRSRLLASAPLHVDFARMWHASWGGAREGG